MHPESMPLSAHQRHERERKNRIEDDAVANAPHRLDFATIQSFAARPPALTVSILLPTHRPGSERTPDHIRAKKLLHAAELRLMALSDAKRAQAMLAPVAAAMLEHAFWHHPQDGLAIFCRDNGFTQIWTPMTLPEQATVSDCCNLKPLMPACQGDGQFYVLTITRHGVQRIRPTPPPSSHDRRRRWTPWRSSWGRVSSRSSCAAVAVAVPVGGGYSRCSFAMGHG